MKDMNYKILVGLLGGAIGLDTIGHATVSLPMSWLIGIFLVTGMIVLLFIAINLIVSATERTLKGDLE